MAYFKLTENIDITFGLAVDLEKSDPEKGAVEIVTDRSGGFKIGLYVEESKRLWFNFVSRIDPGISLTVLQNRDPAGWLITFDKSLALVRKIAK